jgi:hypothetical protein
VTDSSSVCGWGSAGFPNITAELKFFGSAFNRAEAEKNGSITPQPGVDEEFDSACAAVAEHHNELEQILKRAKQYFNDKTIK